MNILCVGDVVGDAGLDFFCNRIARLKRETAADFVVVNGENADKSGVGLSSAAAAKLLDYADVVSGGNHSLRRAKEEFYLENERVIYPANYPYRDDAAGCVTIDTGRHGVLRIINLAGVAWMEPIDSPFARADELLKKESAKFTIVDFHAESTAEKKALAFYLDGQISALFGTHTHVQTADEQVLPKGTGFITDVGMTGPMVSVIGIEPAFAVKKQREHVPVQFAVAGGPCMLNAVLFVLDDESGRCLSA